MYVCGSRILCTRSSRELSSPSNVRVQGVSLSVPGPNFAFPFTLDIFVFVSDLEKGVLFGNEQIGRNDGSAFAATGSTAHLRPLSSYAAVCTTDVEAS